MDCDTWPVPVGGCFNGCEIPDTYSDEEAAALVESASVKAGIILRTLSGGRVGTCTDTIRPLTECRICRGRCCCSGAGDRIRLHSDLGPVTAVTEVNDGGTVVDASDWRFYPSTELLYRVPPDIWPHVDRKWADCGDPDTFCLDVVVGYEPDAWALDVHAELVCEIVASCTDGECRLPKNSATVTGQGVTVTLTPDQIKQFIPAVSSWVDAINPNHAVSLPTLYSPDLDNGCGC